MFPYQDPNPHAGLSAAEPTAPPHRCVMTQDVKDAVAHLLATHLPGPPVATILQDKLASVRCMEPPHETGFALPDRTVVYMVSGGGAQTVRLTLEAPARVVAGHVPVLTPLGATLLGMTRLQRAPLSRADGTVATLVVLGVSDT
ncbi:hypothetical protein JQX09_05785 [Sulfitobacter pseudonitzschiae]|uniref:Regulator of nucleoside diphosphate kinase n=1 Tax=Pseudosulfitobacter pseudonitzschiae TaxID=1402135 RepID=A0A9Q2NRS1_9RHOB|nr:hypothetical protein [Pseudosulfitobacter pseudonitzschiae]MBM2291409.1 hypothetical protein [Pseudosulfitobacter pseudonitzschiae]MBM2296327.1 hypothetical protein [Pseudosulfitobacter pseudonitzschiae]MBM2301240.1 hypothetical protein [Pseudosulfitobacter pseudonitzschiae]MBM2311024.1 hypothetical protein [Pseudosulfitobacter pseudonitzschiae]MBM2315937.1 hypothetical protein [Pseudosulfitobacter pseudonitzschiae]